MSSNPANGEVYSKKHYVIEFACDLWQVDGFVGVLASIYPVSFTNKADHHDITKILLKWRWTP